MLLKLFGGKKIDKKLVVSFCCNKKKNIPTLIQITLKWLLLNIFFNFGDCYLNDVCETKNIFNAF